MEQNMMTIVRTMLESLGTKVTDVREEHEAQGGVIYHIETTDNNKLIGINGERLQAINYLAKRIAEKNDWPTMFHIDIGGYATAHRRKVESMAKIYAERARYFKSPIHMEPMNPYDRLIVHAALSEIGDVSTQSEGTGPNRHVVVHFKENTESVI